MRSEELSDPISLRLPKEMLEAVEQIARAADRTRSWVMVRALRRYLATEGAEVLQICEGRNQIAQGLVHDMDDVLDEVERIIRSPGREST